MFLIKISEPESNLHQCTAKPIRSACVKRCTCQTFPRMHRVASSSPLSVCLYVIVITYTLTHQDRPADLPRGKNRKTHIHVQSHTCTPSYLKCFWYTCETSIFTACISHSLHLLLTVVYIIVMHVCVHWCAYSIYGMPKCACVCIFPCDKLQTIIIDYCFNTFVSNFLRKTNKSPIYGNSFYNGLITC